MEKDPFLAKSGEVIGASDALTARMNLLSSKNTFATVVHAIIRDKYGEEPYWWDPLTVALELKADFTVDPEPEVMNRWSAMQVLMTGDAFFTRIDAFFAVCNAFSSGDPFFGAFDPVTVEEAAWAIVEAGMNRDMLPFSPSIRKYCRIILEQDGYGKDNYPGVFKPMFSEENSLKDIKKGLVSEENGNALNAYLQDNVTELADQFDSIPDLKNVDEELLRTGLTAALRNKA